MPESGKTINSVTRSYLRVTLCFVFAGLMAAAPAQADRRDHRQGAGREAAGSASQRDTGAARAARTAEGRYGGKALKVSPQGDSYGVRLLLPDGTVKSVTVDGAAGD